MLSGCQAKAKVSISKIEPSAQQLQTTYALEDILEKDSAASQQIPAVPERPVATSNLENEDVLEISEKMYLTQIHDIFLNFSDYEKDVYKRQPIIPVRAINAPFVIKSRIWNASKNNFPFP